LPRFERREETMRENSKARNPKHARTCECIHAASAEQKAAEAEHRAKLLEIGRKYTLHVRVLDSEGREVLNVTKLTLGRDLREEGDTIPELQDVLELLVEAAEEHVLPCE
jgi:hypothetical protein